MHPVRLFLFCLMQCGIWGFFAHRKINRLAVFAVPEPLYAFYRGHIDLISERAVNPDRRRHAVVGEAEKHYIDIDHYHDNPDTLALQFPRKWEKAVGRYTEDTLRAYGIGPFNVVWVYRDLVASFRHCDVERIIRVSADLGHYVSDLHVPLHTTLNYNGQLTGQSGIHSFWESRLPELFFEDYHLAVEPAGYVENIREKIWEVVFQSHRLATKVLEKERELSRAWHGDIYARDERNGRSLKVRSERYSLEYHRKLEGMVEQRMQSAIRLVAAMWYSAWVDAGQPDLGWSEEGKNGNSDR